MSSETEICNVALGLLGAGPLTSSLDVDVSKSGRTCQIFYARTRDYLNAQFRWNFALTREVLGGADIDDPAYGFVYAYTLPSGLLRLWETNIPRGIDYKVESGRILTDETNVGILYSRRVTTVSSFTMGFKTTLECLLAMEMSISITREPKIRMVMQEAYLIALNDALPTESQEFRPPVTESDDLILPRFGGSGIYIPLSVD